MTRRDYQTTAKALGRAKQVIRQHNDKYDIAMTSFNVVVDCIVNELHLSDARFDEQQFRLAIAAFSSENE